MKVKSFKTQLAILGASMAVFTAGMPRSLAYIPPESRTLDLKMVNVVHPVDNSPFTKELVTKYIPTNLTPGTNRDQVWSQLQSGIQQRISQALLDFAQNSDLVKKSSVMQISQKIDKVAQTSVSIGSPTPGAVSQKINMAIKTAQKQAVINYEGYINSAITYSAADNNVVWAVTKPVDKTTTLSLTNTTSLGQAANVSMLSISHTF